MHKSKASKYTSAICKRLPSQPRGLRVLFVINCYEKLWN